MKSSVSKTVGPLATVALLLILGLIAAAGAKQLPVSAAPSKEPHGSAGQLADVVWTARLPLTVTATVYLPNVPRNYPPPQQYAWTGEIATTYPNCGLTRLLGITLQHNGGVTGDIWLHVWADGWNGVWEKSSWQLFGTDTPWTGDERNWDVIIDNKPHAGVWHVCVVSEQGSWDCQSNVVDAQTSSDCQTGIQVAQIFFRHS